MFETALIPVVNAAANSSFVIKPASSIAISVSASALVVGALLDPLSSNQTPLVEAEPPELANTVNTKN